MNCPKDGTEMVEQDRYAYQRDVLLELICPRCEGTWTEKRPYGNH